MPSIGSLRSKAFGIVFVFTLVVLGLASHVNHFMGFFYVADRFPFIMSILTLLVLVPLCVLYALPSPMWTSKAYCNTLYSCMIEFVHSGNVRTAKPLFELAWVGALLFAWTGSNAFSTSRWSSIRLSDCASIPVEENPDFLAAAKTWCYEIQALRAFIWMDWAMLTIIFIGLVMFCVGESRRGSSHVWTTPIGRFNPMTSPGPTTSISPSTKGPDMDSIDPDYFWNPDAKAAMPTYAAPSRYAFGNDGTAQMDSKSTQKRVASGDLLGYQADPFSSERELVPTPGNNPSPGQWQQFSSAKEYPTTGVAY